MPARLGLLPAAVVEAPLAVRTAARLAAVVEALLAVRTVVRSVPVAGEPRAASRVAPTAADAGERLAVRTVVRSVLVAGEPRAALTVAAAEVRRVAAQTAALGGPQPGAAAGVALSVRLEAAVALRGERVEGLHGLRAAEVPDERPEAVVPAGPQAPAARAWRQVQAWPLPFSALRTCRRLSLPSSRG